MRVYKTGYTKPIPEGAKIFSRKGTKYAKYKDRRGHTQEAKLTKAGDRLLCKSKNWFVPFEDHPDLKAYTNKEASERLADNIEKILNGTMSVTDLQDFTEQIPSGIKDKLIGFGILDAKRTAGTLDELIREFEKHLTAKERNAKHIAGAIAGIRRLFDGCGFKFWSDIQADHLKAHLDELRDGGRGIGKRTYNGYLKAAKYFCKWVARRLHTTSPIEYIEGLENEGTDIRHPRRAATPDEIRRLLEATAAGLERYGMSGYERALVYRFAVETGFRANEIRTLTAGQFDFDNLTVTIEAAYSKHRREDVQTILPELAAILKEHCKGKLPGAKVFGGSYERLTDRTADMIQADLKDAGIPYKKHGKALDFHALRHTFITNLRNVSSRTAQALARHQSSAMTDRYTHIELHDKRAALKDAVPDYGAPSKQSQKATGTDGKILSKSYNQDAQRRTTTDTGGQQTDVTMQKTPLGADNKGVDETLNQQVEGSSPSSLNTQAPDNKEVTEQPKESFQDRTKNLAEILFSDTDLQEVVLAWPKFSYQAKHICLVLAEKAEE